MVHNTESTGAIEQHTEVPSEPASVDLSEFARLVSGNLSLFLILAVVAVYRYAVQPLLDRISLKLSYSWVEEARVESLLSQIMGATRADRVILFEFHNGEVSKGGRHLNKLSATREVTGPGVTRISQEHQGELIGIYSRVIDRLHTDKILKTEVASLPEGVCKSRFIKNGTEYAITRMLCLNEVPISIVQIQFCRSQREDFDKFTLGHTSYLFAELDALICKQQYSWLKNFLKLLPR